MITKQYLAGFIDGEGTIAIYKHKDTRTKKGYTLIPRFSISNTNKEILEMMNKIIKGKIKISKKQKYCKQVFFIELQDYQQIRTILKSMLPFLILKKKQAELMLEFCKNRINSNGKRYSDRDYELADIFSTINMRGDEDARKYKIKQRNG